MVKNKTTYFILLLLVFINTFSINTTAIETQSKNKKILILGSYNIDSEWELSVINGFKSSPGFNYDVRIEFLDSKNYNSDKNTYNEFLDLLNAKYKNQDIDCILTIDDEALTLVRNNLFNEKSIFYKTQTVFVGVNYYFSRTPEEENYITGILDYQDNLELVNLILNTLPNTENLYLLLDNNIYSETIKSNLYYLKNFSSRQFNLHVIEARNFDELKPQLSDINSSNSAILLCGSYYNDSSKALLPPKKTIALIKDETKAPIFTKLEPYVEGGAIGGIINDGHKLGQMAYLFTENFLNVDTTQILTPAYNTLNIPIFNFKEVRNYNINPTLLPKDTKYINKSNYNLLLPKQIETLIYLVFTLVIVGFILLIYLYLSNRRRAIASNLLLKESIERNNIKTDYVITVSHELRTPLNIIINSSKLLKMKLNTDEFNKEVFDKQLSYIDKNSTRLLKLVNNLIDVSKIEIGYMDINYTMSNIVEVVEETALSTVEFAKSFNIELIIDTEEEEIITAFDKVKIERVILNLISNSIKSIKDHGEIYINILKDEHNVIIKVEDTGAGIPKDMLPSIFEKFKKAHSYDTLQRDQEGSGLGLYIVKGLIELHKGTINVSSILGKGSIFTITLPLIYIDEDNPSSNLLDSDLDNLKSIELSDI